MAGSFLKGILFAWSKNIDSNGNKFQDFSPQLTVVFNSVYHYTNL